jgi:hypothetical protein
MPILYDYLNLVGETNWYVAPAEVISTKNVEPIRMSTSGPQTALTGDEVINLATGSGNTQQVAQPTPAQQAQPAKSSTKPAVKKVNAQ